MSLNNFKLLKVRDFFLCNHLLSYGFSCKNTEKIIPFIVYTIHKILHYKREILSLYQVNLGCSDPRILIATINIHSIRYFSKLS